MKIEVHDKAIEIRPENAADRAFLEKFGAMKEGDVVAFVRQDHVLGYGKTEKFHIRIDLPNKGDDDGSGD